MTDKSREMQTIFNELSDTNKDIMLLIAKSVETALEAAGQNENFGEQSIQSFFHSRNYGD